MEIFIFLCTDFSPCARIFSLWGISNGSRRLRRTQVLHQTQVDLGVSGRVSERSSKRDWTKCPDWGRKPTNVSKLVLWDRWQGFKGDDGWWQFSGWLKILRRQPVGGQVQLGMLTRISATHSVRPKSHADSWGTAAERPRKGLYPSKEYGNHSKHFRIHPDYSSLSWICTRTNTERKTM